MTVLRISPGEGEQDFTPTALYEFILDRHAPQSGLEAIIAGRSVIVPESGDVVAEDLGVESLIFEQIDDDGEISDLIAHYLTDTENAVFEYSETKRAEWLEEQGQI